MALLIIYAIVSILFSFICSILEAVFLSITPTFIRMKKNDGKAYAAELETLKQNVDQPLIAILTINTVAHTIGAILVGVQAEKVFSGGGNMVGIVSAVMTFAILVFSEIIPKTIGANNWQTLGNVTAKTLNVFIFPLKYSGVIWLLMRITKLFGKSSHGNTMTRREYVAITDAALEEGVFEKGESTILKNLLAFKKIHAQNVMTPFSVAIIAEQSTAISVFLERNKTLNVSRIPVFEKRRNNITGFVLKDDLLEMALDGKENEPLSVVRKEIPITTKEEPVPDLLNMFVKQRSHIALVVDEYGNTVGLVTMEDIIETLLGLEIMDESDSVEDMQVLARKNWKDRAEKIGLFDQKQDNSDDDSVISE